MSGVEGTFPKTGGDDLYTSEINRMYYGTLRKTELVGAITSGDTLLSIDIPAEFYSNNNQLRFRCMIIQDDAATVNQSVKITIGSTDVATSIDSGRNGNNSGSMFLGNDTKVYVMFDEGASHGTDSVSVNLGAEDLTTAITFAIKAEQNCATHNSLMMLEIWREI